MWGTAICAAATLPELAQALRVPQAALLREVVDLNDGAWVKVLNVLDSCLEAVLRAHPTLVAIWDIEGPPKPRPVAAEAQRIADAISRVKRNLATHPPTTFCKRRPCSWPLFLNEYDVGHHCLPPERCLWRGAGLLGSRQNIGSLPLPLCYTLRACARMCVPARARMCVDCGGWRLSPRRLNLRRRGPRRRRRPCPCSPSRRACSAAP